MVRDLEMRRRATCDLEINCVPTHTYSMYYYGFALPALRDTFKTCGWQTLLFNPRQGFFHPSMGLSHQAKCAAQWRQLLPGGSWVWSHGLVCLKEQRTVGSDISTNPPLLGLARPLLLSLITEISAEKQRGHWGWVVAMLIHTAALWKHGEASWEARERERQRGT